jgi:hypothetical protein
MWLISGDSLFSIPDGSRIPEGAKPIEPPEDFQSHPERWTIREGRFVRVEPVQPLPPLTADEIRALRAAIAAGKL